MKRITSIFKLPLIAFMLYVMMTGVDCVDEGNEYLYMYLKNSTNDTIYEYECFTASDGSVIEARDAFEEYDTIYDLTRKVAPGEQIELFNRVLWEKAKQGVKFQLIIFEQSTKDKYSKKELIENNIYDKRYVLTLEEMIRTKYRIVYTGE